MGARGKVAAGLDNLLIGSAPSFVFFCHFYIALVGVAWKETCPFSTLHILPIGHSFWV